MENAGINIAVEAIAYIRGVRLDLNRNLTDAKLEIKEKAISLFMEHLDTLLEADKDASDTFKNGFSFENSAITNLFSLVCLPLTAKSVLISCSLSFISLLKFLDFPLIVSRAISLPLNPFLKVSLASLSASNDFIVSAKSDADKLKGLKIANDNDIAEVSANIKELNADQETLTKARDILMENAGINIAVEAIAYIRGVRLDLNRNLTDAKLEIKENNVIIICYLQPF
jgi:Fe-S cluster assembly iron-binding protein IscA